MSIKTERLLGVITDKNKSSEDWFADLEFNLADIPVLPLRGLVAFPFVSIPLPIGRDSSLKLVTKAAETGDPIFLVAQKDMEVEEPKKRDLYNIGVIGKVHKVIQLPDGTSTAFITTGPKFKLLKLFQYKPYLHGEIDPVEGDVFPENNEKFEIQCREIFGSYRRLLDLIGEQETQELRYALSQIDNAFRAINFISLNVPSPFQERQKNLEMKAIDKKYNDLIRMLNKSIKEMEYRKEIQDATRAEMTQQQREHFLQTQIRTIQQELGMTDADDFEKLSARAEEKVWSEELKETFAKELRKLERFNPTTPDYAIQYNFLDTMLNLPWNNISNEDFTLDKVEEILERDHFGLEKVKERIVEQMAVLKLRSDMKAPILCLFGPPGVGKTSLGKSVADALGREYCRVSLGGLHDEAEIRGHRRTYIGAMPGRIISALAKCKSNNPVFVLDEIDKIGKDFKGDPSTALLEVLDPEQNNKFHDNYIDCDYDLSKILFIATANDLSTISRPLLDRMEIIEIDGYIPEEKIEIARRHLVAKSLEEHGFPSDEITFRRDALAYIVERYTRESGVRQLEKRIAKILRKIARLKASDKDYPRIVTLKNVKEFLGKEEVNPDSYESNEFLGVVTGLAWTQVGGEILFIESSLSEGKGEKLTLTGNLGAVMKESAVIALQYLKAHARQLGIDPKKFSEMDVHVHVPEGAIPKDGPSAGITMVTSLASSFTGRKVRSKVAMTGEITLRGKVLPVGGIKEKILAAKRAGITDIVLCEENRKDIEEISDRYLEGLTFHYVSKIEEVLDFALE